MKRSLTRTVVFAFTVFLISLSATFAQTERGSIVGTVTDPGGGVVAGAAITVTNLGNKTSQTLTTNSEGIYNVPFLIPGNYEVLAAAPGFSKTVVSDVTVNVGSRASVNIVLKVGQVSETVQVTDQAPLLQTENASVGQVITSQQLTDLPSSNRNVYNFLSIDSTVNGQGVNSSNAESFRLESGGTMSISGGRPSSNTFKIDGQANNDQTFGTPVITPALETVKEFLLQNNAYSAEYEGFAQINVATKSGTSRFHGSLFEFGQNDFFQPTDPRLPIGSNGKHGKSKLRFNQFGGSVGGPIWTPHFGEGGPVFDKNKTFFFFSYEGLRNNGRGPAFARVLTQAERSGDFSANLGGCVTAKVGTTQVPVPLLNPDGTPSGDCVHTGQIFDPSTTVPNPSYTGSSPSVFNPQFIRQPFAGNKIPAGRLSSTALALINAVQPLPNFTSTSDLNYAGTAGSNFLNDQTAIRIDHQATPNDSIYGRFTWQNNRRDTEAVLPYAAVDLKGNGRVFNSSWTHIVNPTLINEFRFGYLHGDYGQAITEVDPTQFGITNTLLKTLPVILLTSGGQLSYGGFAGSILETTQTTYQLSDSVSLTRGRHSLKAGFNIDFNRFENIDHINSNGRLDFSGLYSIGNSSLSSSASRPNSIADFLLGDASNQVLNVPNPAIISSNPWAFYVQDDWKLSPQLTVNLGLRYELHQPWRDKNLGGRMVDLTGDGRLLVRDPEVARLANDPRVVCCTGPGVVPTDKNDFAPRLGIAWRPFKSDNTVIRAGYGIFYTNTNQFYHWLYYAPLSGLGSFESNTASFTSPAATFSDPFPSDQFTPPGSSGIFIGVPNGVNKDVLKNGSVISVSGLGPYKTPMSQEWSVGVQREIMRNMVLDVSYKGSRTRNLPVQWFFNQPTFSDKPANFGSTVAEENPYLRRPYENFTIGSNIVANVLKAWYDALTVKVDKRFSGGYSFLSTYTYSHSVDQGAETGSLGQNHAFLPNNRDFNAGKGVSILDIPHRWVTSGTVELPFGKGKMFLDKGGFVNAIFGGWRLSGIFTLQSGQPFSPYLLTAAGHTNTGVSVVERGNFGNTAPFTDEEWKAALDAWNNGSRLYIIRPDAIDLNYTGVGNIPRNAFRYLYTRRLDWSLAKTARFGEFAKLELRLDVFNATQEVLHNQVFHTQVAGANALTNPLWGSIPARNIYFLPQTLQLGVRVTF